MIKFREKIDVSELIKDNFDDDCYYVTQFDADRVEVLDNWVEVPLDFRVMWDDPDITVEIMWDRICGEFDRPVMLDSREVS